MMRSPAFSGSSSLPSSVRCVRSTRILLALAACAALAGCGDDDSMGAADAGALDGGGADSGPAIDAGHDAAIPDAGRDAGADAGTDAGTDASSPDAGLLDPAPPFRTPVAMPDAELAAEALRILGAPEAGGSDSCRSCHALSRQRIRQWHSLSDFAWRACFDDLEVRSVARAQAVVECVRNAAGRFDVHRLGVFSSAARLAWFPFVFERALGEGWNDQYVDFADRAGMPYEVETHPALTQEEFDVVAEWFIRGVPQLDAVLPADPAPTVCQPSVFPEVAAHVSEMTVSGWGALNRDNGVLMYGCAGAATPLDCLASKPRASATSFGAQWETPEGTHLRVLSTYSNQSSFWTRSSADGRFVAHGGGDGGRSTFIDLQQNRVIGANASYDPAFFPDNSGFVFQGSGAHFCEQSVLFTGMPSTITFNEPQCETNNTVGLYEHVGASLGGGDYWAVHGTFISDNGPAFGGDPSASFPASTVTKLTRLVNDGTGFSPRETLNVATPYEGDAVISPSSRLMVTRLGASGPQQGYVLRRINAQRDVAGNWSISVPEIGRYCINGGKPAISFDERWMVLHHYESDRADVWLVDLLDGSQTRITNMQAGQYALFPHFRSDGWIYFIVRGAPGGEYVIASDAALVLAQE